MQVPTQLRVTGSPNRALYDNITKDLKKNVLNISTLHCFARKNPYKIEVRDGLNFTITVALIKCVFYASLLSYMINPTACILISVFNVLNETFKILLNMISDREKLNKFYMLVSGRDMEWSVNSKWMTNVKYAIDDSLLSKETYKALDDVDRGIS